MKRKVIPVLIGLLLIVLILAGAAGVFLFQRYSGSKEEADLNAYFGLNGSQEVAIVWNQELTEEKGLLQDERCYLKLDTVHEMLNERFYVDHNEKLLLYTLPEDWNRGADCRRIYSGCGAERGCLACAGLCKAVFGF